MRDLNSLLELHRLGISFHAEGLALRLRGDKSTLTPELITKLRQNQQQMLLLCASIAPWEELIVSVESIDEIFALVELFRIAARWTDEERSKISQTYIRRLSFLSFGRQ